MSLGPCCKQRAFVTDKTLRQIKAERLNKTRTTNQGPVALCLPWDSTFYSTALFCSSTGVFGRKKKKNLSVVFEITSIGLEIAGRWPCKVDQRVDRPCHIVLDEDPALKCPETAGGQVLAHFSMTFFSQIQFALQSRRADFGHSERMRL